jgi:hypothetical protein
MSEVTDVGVVWIWPDNTTVPTNLSDSTSTTPAFPTPSWIIPPNPGRSLQVDIAVCTVITFLIGLGFVIIRFYTRWVNRVLCHSDWCILLALVRTCLLLCYANSSADLPSSAPPVSWAAPLNVSCSLPG